MTTTETELKLRAFLKDDLMKEQAEFITLEDELTLDSLDQTELRVFLTDEFKINTDFETLPPESLSNLKNIIELIPVH